MRAGTVLWAVAFAVAAVCGLAWAQGNRPPIAAPVTTIDVGELPLVRSQSEVVDDLVSGLIAGLMTNYRQVEGVAFLAVTDNHVSLRKDFGGPEADTPFAAGTLSDLVLAVAAAQQIEGAKLLANENVAPGVTAEQALTRQAASDRRAFVETIERVSGEPFANYLSTHVFAPLKMTQSAWSNGRLTTSVRDMAQLMIALIDGGAADDGRILDPATVELIERTHFTIHPALPGRAYGFDEMRKNGWRALAADGSGQGIQYRLVLVPQARFGYFILVRGYAGTAFWRTLDDNLFGRIFAPQGETDFGLRGLPAPDQEQARAASGIYGAAPALSFAPLKIAGTRLNVEAGEEGALLLSGAENAVLAPREGGYWSGEEGNLNAVVRNGLLVLSSGIYVPLPLWQRWDIYLLAGFLMAFFTTGVLSYEHRGRRAAYAPGNLVLLGGSVSAALLLVALSMWLFAPVT